MHTSAKRKEELAVWQSKRIKSGSNVRQRPSTTKKTKRPADFANNENAPGSSGKHNRFGFSGTPTEKRKAEEARTPLTPVEKKLRPHNSARKSLKSISATLKASLDNQIDEATSVMKQTVLGGIPSHKLNEKIKALKGRVRDIRASYTDFISFSKNLLNACEKSEQNMLQHVEQQNNDKDELNERIYDLNTSMAELRSTIQTLESKIQAGADRRNALIVEKDELKTKNKEVLADLEKLMASDTEAKAEIETLRAQNEEKSAAYDKLSAVYNAEKEQAAATIKQLQTEQEAERQQAKAKMNEEVNALQSQLAAEKENLKQAMFQCEELKQRIQLVESSKNEIAAAKTQLEHQHQELKLAEAKKTWEIQQFQQREQEREKHREETVKFQNMRYEQMEKTAERERQQGDQLKLERDSLNTQLAEINAKHSTLSIQHKELEAQCATLQSKLTEVSSSHDELKEQLEKAQSELEYRQETLEQLEAEHNKVKTTFETAQQTWESAKLEWEDKESQLTAQVAEGHEKVNELKKTLSETSTKLESATSQLNDKNQDLKKAVQFQNELLKNISNKTDNNQSTLARLVAEKVEMSVQLEQNTDAAMNYELSQREVKRLQKLLLESESARRKLHNRVQELRGNIRVFVRVRPFLPGDGDEYETKQPALKCLSDGQAINVGDKKEHKFSFDRVFKRGSSQEMVFEEVSELVQSALDGYNVCIFSYGQTGSGKTYTMQGVPDDPAQRGLIPRSMEQIIAASSRMEQQGWQFDFQASFVEIYNEQVRDLLRKDKSGEKCDIKRSAKGKTFVHGVEKMDMKCMEDVSNIMRIAASKRAVGCTAMNSVSSRSHSVFTIFIHGKCEQHNKRIIGALNLCDLAGSERLARSKATGAALKETQAINKSLSALADVFMALKTKKSHVPYRNSKLTYMLENCFSKDGKTMMLVNVSPTMLSQQETTCSLRFAAQVNQCELGRANAQVQELASSKTPRPRASSRSRIPASKTKRSRK